MSCSSFVAKSMNRLPMTTPGAFNMAKLSKDIASVLKIEDNDCHILLRVIVFAERFQICDG